MSETIVTKQCTKCKELKHLSDFYKSRRRGRIEYFAQCKSCYKNVVKKYRKTEKGKEVHIHSVKRYQKTEKGKRGKKIASKKYRQSEKGKETLLAYYRKYYASENGKKAYKKYRRTAKRRIASRKYYRSEKGKACLQRSIDNGNKKTSEQKYRLSNQKQIQARHAVNHAVERNELPLASSLKCLCGNRAKEYHHHKGYEPKYWLDVVALCSICHGFFHRDNYSRVVLMRTTDTSTGAFMYISRS